MPRDVGLTTLPAMPDKPRILIVGAGIAGVTLAAGLERCGITPSVVELEKASLSRGLALMLTSNVAVALRRIGLDRVVFERATVVPGQKLNPDVLVMQPTEN